MDINLTTLETLKPRYYHLRDMRRPKLSDSGKWEPQDLMLDALQLGQINSHRAWGTVPQVSAVTLCVLENENREEVARGYAFCSCLDNFCKATGRKIALDRAKYALRTGRKSTFVQAEETEA